MKTRKEYMDGKATHDAYYDQFVTPAVRSLVANSIGVERIKASKDPHMNDIPLPLWDRLEPFMRAGCVSSNALKEAGEGWSLSTNVCIAKAAARRIKEKTQ